MATSEKNMRDFQTDEESWWCPGCGDFGVLAALQQSFAGIGLENEEIALIAGIGCSGKISNYAKTYAYHALHGRALPTAASVKLANKDLTVVAAGGDGDGYGIGAGHFVHTIRRNIDITYIVMDNQVYGLTKGQISPTSDLGYITGTTPDGNFESPINPLALAMSSGITYLAQAFSGDVKGMKELIQGAMEHNGFALVNVFSPCITYNRKNTYAWYRDVLVDLSETDHDPTDKAAAWEIATSPAEHYGLIYKEERPSYHELSKGLQGPPLAEIDPANPGQDYSPIFDEFK